MQVDVCIQTRRSVRKYSDQDISGDTLREIVDPGPVFPILEKYPGGAVSCGQKRGPQGEDRAELCAGL